MHFFFLVHILNNNIMMKYDILADFIMSDNTIKNKRDLNNTVISVDR